MPSPSPIPAKIASPGAKKASRKPFSVGRTVRREQSYYANAYEDARRRAEIAQYRLAHPEEAYVDLPSQGLPASTPEKFATVAGKQVEGGSLALLKGILLWLLLAAAVIVVGWSVWKIAAKVAGFDEREKEVIELDDGDDDDDVVVIVGRPSAKAPAPAPTPAPAPAPALYYEESDDDMDEEEERIMAEVNRRAAKQAAAAEVGKNSFLFLANIFGPLFTLIFEIYDTIVEILGAIYRLFGDFCGLFALDIPNFIANFTVNWRIIGRDLALFVDRVLHGIASLLGTVLLLTFYPIRFIYNHILRPLGHSFRYLSTRPLISNQTRIAVDNQLEAFLNARIWRFLAETHNTLVDNLARYLLRLFWLSPLLLLAAALLISPYRNLRNHLTTSSTPLTHPFHLPSWAQTARARQYGLPPPEPIARWRDLLDWRPASSGPSAETVWTRLLPLAPSVSATEPEVSWVTLTVTETLPPAPAATATETSWLAATATETLERETVTEVATLTHFVTATATAGAMVAAGGSFGSEALGHRVLEDWGRVGAGGLAAREMGEQWRGFCRDCKQAHCCELKE